MKGINYLKTWKASGFKCVEFQVFPVGFYLGHRNNLVICRRGIEAQADFCHLLGLHLWWTTGCHHPGVEFTLTLLGHDIILNIYDVRHREEITAAKKK